VHVSAVSDRADLSGREEAREAVDAELLADDNGVMVRAGEELSAAAVAGEEQRSLDRVERPRLERLEGAAQVLVGGSGVT